VAATRSTVQDLLMGVLGWTAWHQASRDGKFHWRRWRKGDWEIREMTSDEQDDALRGIQLTIRCPPYAHIDPRQGSARATKVPHRELKPLGDKRKGPRSETGRIQGLPSERSTSQTAPSTAGPSPVFKL